ncbi:hypothetical protein J1N35_039855 [Gossypium stocksii]|uniref:Uncharacterized protein n=1 Tax=Gossypium stocksii TaxID=47602 RepID=A0A9D3ZHR0_9ROSI|nr:hypothetical protein J1N35_039855 [Gossypium stocksii]
MAFYVIISLYGVYGHFGTVWFSTARFLICKNCSTLLWLDWVGGAVLASFSVDDFFCSQNVGVLVVSKIDTKKKAWILPPVGSVKFNIDTSVTVNLGASRGVIIEVEILDIPREANGTTDRLAKAGVNTKCNVQQRMICHLSTYVGLMSIRIKQILRDLIPSLMSLESEIPFDEFHLFIIGHSLGRSRKSGKEP